MRIFTEKGSRRLLSFLLTVLMVVQLVPAGIFSAEQTDSTFQGFTNWTAEGCQLEAVAGVSGSGAQITAEADAAVLKSDVVAVTPGEQLRAGIFVTIPTGGKATLQMQWYSDATGKKALGEPAVVAAQDSAGDYVELAGDVTVPEKAQAVRLQLVTGSGTYVADNASIRTYSDLPEFLGVMGDGYGVEGQWSLFYPLMYADGDWSEQKTAAQDPYGFNYAQIVEEGKDDRGAVRFLRNNVYEHIGIAIGANMEIGKEYTIKMHLKGQSAQSYGGMQIYGQGDPTMAVFGPEGECSDPNTWYAVSQTVTATRNHLYIFMSGGGYACDILMDHVQVLDSEGNDILKGAGNFTGNGTVTLGINNRILNGDFELTVYTYLPLEEWNGSFENAQQVTSDLHWSMNTGSNDRLTVEMDDNGQYLLVTKADAEAVLQAPKVEVTAGKTYQFKLDMKTTAQAAVGGWFYDAAGQTLEFWDSAVTYEQTEWSVVGSFLTVPEGAVFFQPMILFVGNPGDTLGVDNAALHPCREEQIPGVTEPSATEPDVTEAPATEPVDGKIPTAIDTSKKSDAYTCSYTDQWVPMYPSGTPGGTWPAWDSTHYGEVVAEGHNDVGAMHLVSAPGKNTGVAINAGMTPGQRYTLTLWVKGASNSGRVLSMYANGDSIIIETSADLSDDWSQYSVTFTATGSQLNILAADWGNTEVYLDNISLTDANGTDLLAGKGDFYTEGTAEPETPETTQAPSTGTTLVPTTLDTSVAYPSWGGAPKDAWSIMYETGNPGGTWAAWNPAGRPYGKIVKEGHNDPGALHLASDSYKNAGVCISVDMAAGQTYKLGLWAKGSSNSGRVLSLYGNGDKVIIGASGELSADWKYYEISITADRNQLNMLAADWGTTDIYIDNITLTNANGEDLLAGYGDFCTEGEAEPETPTPETPKVPMIPTTLDTSKKCDAYTCSYTDEWVPMFPTGNPQPGTTWLAWDATHYGEIAAQGHNDAGSLHLISAPTKNTGVAINAGMTPGQRYTLSLWVKGSSNSGRVLSMYANGDSVIIGASSELSADWKEYSVTFTATGSQLNILAADWGNTEIYIDNIVLKDAGANDLLAGRGDFCVEDPNPPAATEPEATEPEATEPEMTEPETTAPVMPEFAILDTETVASHGVAFYDRWAKFYPTGTAGSTWPAWDDTHYGEVVEKGYQDTGALHLVSAPTKNAGVSIDVPMTPGKTYKLGMWVKGSSNSGRVLALYGNGDPAIIGSSEELSVDWQYYEINITATMTQLTVMAVDWGNTDLYIDNITLIDETGKDLLAYRGDFCKHNTAAPRPDESVNLLGSGDFEGVSTLSIPGWTIDGTVTEENGTLTLKAGAAIQSLRYSIEPDQIFFARYTGTDGVMQVQFGNQDAAFKTVDVGAEGQLFSVPEGAQWLRVRYAATDKPATVSLVELIDKGDPSNLDFEMKAEDSGLPMNWTTWTAVNDPSLTYEKYLDSYMVEHQEGTGVEESNALHVTINKALPENTSQNTITAVVDSIEIDVEPNTTYSFSYWVKMDAQSGCVYPSVRAFREDGSADGGTQWMNGAFATDASGQWKQYKTTFTTGANTKRIAFRLEMKGSNQGGQFWVDGLAYKVLGSALETNLDFEIGQEGMLPLNWTTYERNFKNNAEGVFGDYTASWAPASAADGSAALKVKKLNGNPTEMYVCSTLIKVDPNSAYYFGYEAASLSAASGDQIMMMLRQKKANGDNVADETKAFYWPTNAYATGHFNWSDFGAIFETAVDCEYIQIMFCIRAGSGYTAFIDNVALTKTEKIEDMNLDFEYSVGKIPLNWSFNGVLAKSSMTVSSENVFSGKQALRVLREDGELDCSFVYSERMIPVKAGDKIEVVFNTSSRNAISGHFSACFFGYGEPVANTAKMVNAMYGQERVTNAGSQWSQWDTYEMVWTVPKGVNYIQLCLRIGGTANDMLIDDITVYNYTQSDNMIYFEDFRNPSITTGLPGGWEKGEITGSGEAKVNGQMSLTGNEDSNVEIFTKLYYMKTDFVYALTANVFTTGTAKGQLIMEAINWDGSVAGQPVELDLSTGETDQELKANFESLSASYYRLILRKTEGNGSVCVKNITIHQTGEPYKGITWAGKWLTHPDETARISNSPHPFTERHYFTRTELNLDKPIETAQMQITADDKFTLYINGMQVYEETRTGDTWDLPVTVDIAQYLQQGKNIIAIDMFNNIYLYGLLFDGIVKMEDESSLRFYSTGDTMIAAECLSDEMVPTRNPLWTDEDQMSWMQVDYDISTCPLWVHADEFASIGGGGWGDLSFDPTEYSDYKIFSNEFTFPEEEITAGDTIKVTAQLFIEKELPEVNSFRADIWKRNTTSRICSGVLTIAGGKTTADWPIGEEFTAEFELAIPQFLAEGAYTVQLENTVSIVSDYFINNKVGNIKVVQIERPLTTTSSVEVIDGKTQMIVNGEAVAPMWYARPERPAQFQEHIVTEFGEVGVDIVVSYVFLNNVYGDVWTPEGFVPDLVDAMMLDTLAGNPDAKLIVAIDLNAPQWWCEENPGEMAALSETEVTKNNASFASQKWKEESGAIMLDAIDHMMSQPYANSIIGFKITGGYTLEWNWWATSGIYTDVPDFSECGVNAFRAWLTEKYGTDAALQEAWGDNSVTLETVMPPAKEDRRDDYWDSVVSVQDMPDFMDFEIYMAEVKADTIEYFCALANQHLEDRLIVGTYAGYFYMGGGYEFSSAVANHYYQRILQSENIDFVKTPWQYGMRETGDSSQFMGPVDSVSLNGKLWIVEEDSRMNRKEMSEGQDGRAAVGWTRDYQQTVENLKRNFSYILAKGMGVSFYNLMWDFFDDAQYYGVIGQMHQEMTLSLGLSSQSVADIAVFVDGDSQMLIPWDGGYTNNTLYQSIYVEQLEALGHVGATYDMYLMDDLADGTVPEHKINIFIGDTWVDAEERAAVEALQKNGNILVWIFTSGISDGEKTDISLIEDVTGMDLNVISTKRKQIATAKVIDNSHWLTEGINIGRPYGVKGYDLMSPVIAITDKTVTPLAYHSTTSTTDGTPDGQVALGVKEMGDWTSVYSAVPNIPIAMIKNMLKKTDSHIYTDCGSDVIYANANYVALHSNFAGERTIDLPGNYTVYDVFNRQIISTNTDSFTVTLSGKETRLFRLSEPNTTHVYVAHNTGGSVSAKGLTTLTPGDSLTFTVTPDEGYRLSYAFIDGKKTFLDSNSYTFEDIQESHTVIAYFSPSYGDEEAEITPVEPKPAEEENSWLIPAVCGGVGLLALIAVIILLAKRKKVK